MVGPDIFLTGLLTVLGLAAGGGGFLYNRDTKQQEDIDANADSIAELDRGFAQVTTRLFGHPDDESDRGAVPKRAEEIERAEENIDSLSDEVQTVKRQAEDNGECIEHLEGRMAEHAEETQAALERIEGCLSDQGALGEDEDLLRDGGDPDGD